MSTDRTTTTAHDALGDEAAERLGLGVRRQDEYSLEQIAKETGVPVGELAQWKGKMSAEQADDAHARVAALRDAKGELAAADARKRALEAAGKAEDDAA